MIIVDNDRKKCCLSVSKCWSSFGDSSSICLLALSVVTTTTFWLIWTDYTPRSRVATYYGANIILKLYLNSFVCLFVLVGSRSWLSFGNSSSIYLLALYYITTTTFLLIWTDYTPRSRVAMYNWANIVLKLYLNSFFCLFVCFSGQHKLVIIW